MQVGGTTGADLGLNITFLNAHYHTHIDSAADDIHIVTKFMGEAHALKRIVNLHPAPFRQSCA